MFILFLNNWLHFPSATPSQTILLRLFSILDTFQIVQIFVHDYKLANLCAQNRCVHKVWKKCFEMFGPFLTKQKHFRWTPGSFR